MADDQGGGGGSEERQRLQDLLYKVFLLYHDSLNLAMPLSPRLQFQEPFAYMNNQANDYLVKVNTTDLRERTLEDLNGILRTYRRNAFISFQFLRTNNPQLLLRNNRVSIDLRIKIIQKLASNGIGPSISFYFCFFKLPPVTEIFGVCHR